MKIKVPLIILAAVLISGCSVLTDSQVKNINAFALTTKNYSYFPGEVFRKRAEFHLNNELLQASQFSDPAIIARTVTNARAHYKTVMQLSDKFDLSLKLLQQYALLLVKLSSDSYNNDLALSTKDLNENLSSLFTSYNAVASAKLPEELGKHITDIILIAGKRLTRVRQAKELKKFIPEGNALIKATTNNLIEVLDKDTFTGLDGVQYNSLKSLLAKENADFLSSYKNIVLANTQPNGNKVSYGSIQSYSNTIADFDNTETLRQVTVQAAIKLATAHDQLTIDIQRKKTLPEIKQEIQDLIKDVQQLAKIVNAFKPESTTKE